MIGPNHITGGRSQGGRRHGPGDRRVSCRRTPGYQRGGEQRRVLSWYKSAQSESWRGRHRRLYGSPVTQTGWVVGAGSRPHRGGCVLWWSSPGVYHSTQGGRSGDTPSQPGNLFYRASEWERLWHSATGGVQGRLLHWTKMWGERGWQRVPTSGVCMWCQRDLEQICWKR